MAEDKDELQEQPGAPRPSVLVGDGKALRTVVLAAVFALAIVSLTLILRVAVPLAEKAIASWKERSARERSEEQAQQRAERERAARMQEYAEAPAGPVENGSWLADYSEIPAASPDIAEPAHPTGNPGSWVTNDDYPPEALRGRQEGVVGFTLAIAPDGSVSGCRIEASSGYRALDEAVCTLLAARGEFEPARDADARPVMGHWSSRFRWVLER